MNNSIKHRIGPCLLLLISLTFSLVNGQDDGLLVSVDNDISHVLTKQRSHLVSIPFNIQDGYHIQSDDPMDKSIIATDFNLEPQIGFHTGEVSYPASISIRKDDSNDLMDVFESKLNIDVPVLVHADIAPGIYKLKGTLHYQACSDRSCMLPMELDVVLDVYVMD